VPDAAAVAALAGTRVLAFAGIADAEKFFATLRDAGLTVAATQRFADHHRFGAREADDLIAQAERSRLTLVTTEKDQARMVGDPALAALAARAKALPVTLALDQGGGLRDLLEGLFF
jgi:tetraacyldisaccharide 4'-kinase